MIECDCEECGLPATRTLHGIFLCDDCEHGGAEPEDNPQWANEIPSGLLDDEDEIETEGAYP